MYLNFSNIAFLTLLFNILEPLRIIHVNGFHVLNCQTNRKTAVRRVSSFLTASKKSAKVQLENIQVPALLQPNNIVPTNVMTLSRFMIEATRSNPDHADMESLIESIQIACKSISNLLSRTGLIDATMVKSSLRARGSSAKESTRNEVIYEMAMNILKNLLAFTGKLGIMTFDQEEENPILFEESWNSPYLAVFDALDGVTNVDIGIATGTIFGIFRTKEECLIEFGEQVSEEGKKRLLRNLQPSESLVAAGYVLYSSTTILVFTMGEGNSSLSSLFRFFFLVSSIDSPCFSMTHLGVHGFTLDPYLGEFVLTHPNIRIPSRGRTYSLNEARAPWWPAGLREYVEDIKQGKGESGQTYTSRYIGSLVADVHRTLMKGGVFGYPGDTKSAPKGKLRYLHEVRPMAMIIEQAGGKASTGEHRILETKAETLTENVSTFLGSHEDIEEIETYLKKFRAMGNKY